MKRILAYLVLLIVFSSSSFALVEEDLVLVPEDIIRKAIDARGGEEALSKFSGHRDSLKGFMFHDKMKAPVKVDILVRINPCSYRLNVIIEPSDAELVTQTIVFNGQKVWYNRNGVTREGNDEELAAARAGVVHNSEILLLFPILNKHRFTLNALPPAKIKGRDTVGVRVSSHGYPDVQLYFDKKTWLVAKSEYRYKDKIHEEFFEGQKRLKNGIVFAARKTKVVDGNKQLELEVVDVEPLTEVKDSEFSKP